MPSSWPFLSGERPEARPRAHLLPPSWPFLSGENPQGQAARLPAPFLPALPVRGDTPEAGLHAHLLLFSRPFLSGKTTPRGRATCPPARRSGGNHRLPPVSPQLPLCSNCRPLWFLLLAKNKRLHHDIQSVKPLFFPHRTLKCYEIPRWQEFTRLRVGGVLVDRASVSRLRWGRVRPGVPGRLPSAAHNQVSRLNSAQQHGSQSSRWSHTALKVGPPGRDSWLPGPEPAGMQPPLLWASSQGLPFPDAQEMHRTDQSA